MQATLPSKTACLALMNKYEMLDNIKAHSLMVARVAETLYNDLAATIPAEKLPKRDVVIAGALLHDIAKSRCIKEGCRHAEIGAKICFDEGLDELAEIVAEHVLLTDYSSSRCHAGIFRPKELVYYSDKRVKHDQIVSLDNRLEYIIKRYGKNDTRIIGYIKKNFAMCKDLEQALFSFLDYQPEDLVQKAAIS